MQHIDSALYTGSVFHSRVFPKKHHFAYNIAMFFIALDEVPTLAKKIDNLHHNKRGWIEFRDSDYLDKDKLSVLKSLALPTDANLQERAITLMRHLGNQSLNGRVYLLSHLRCMGLYFSPVNFYYLQNKTGQFTHVLAEVSNTPWNERHCYLVDLANPKDSQKVFHVSPYNPLDMRYQWKITQPGEKLNLTIDCVTNEKHFTAGIALNRHPLNNRNVKQVLRSIPNMTLKTMLGIYWQALKLFVKRLPIYDHPKGTI